MKHFIYKKPFVDSYHRIFFYVAYRNITEHEIYVLQRYCCGTGNDYMYQFIVRWMNVIKEIPFSCTRSRLSQAEIRIWVVYIRIAVLT